MGKDNGLYRTSIRSACISVIPSSLFLLIVPIQINRCRRCLAGCCAVDYHNTSGHFYNRQIGQVVSPNLIDTVTHPVQAVHMIEQGLTPQAGVDGRRAPIQTCGNAFSKFFLIFPAVPQRFPKKFTITVNIPDCNALSLYGAGQF